MKQGKVSSIALIAAAVLVVGLASWSAHAQIAKTSLLAQVVDGTDTLVCPAVECPPDCELGCTQDENGCTTGVCKEVEPVCGDAFCDELETSDACPQDCPVDTECGNKVCEESEDPSNCEEDCGEQQDEIGRLQERGYG